MEQVTMSSSNYDKFNGFMVVTKELDGKRNRIFR